MECPPPHPMWRQLTKQTNYNPNIEPYRFFFNQWLDWGKWENLKFCNMNRISFTEGCSVTAGRRHDQSLKRPSKNWSVLLLVCRFQILMDNQDWNLNQLTTDLSKGIVMFYISMFISRHASFTQLVFDSLIKLSDFSQIHMAVCL